jgi:hypothetical protein
VLVLIGIPWMRKTSMEKKAKEAFVYEDFELAVDLYTRASELDPLFYVDRAQVIIKLDKFTDNCNYLFVISLKLLW